MNKEQQNRLWNGLSESRRTHLKSMFINDQNGNEDEYTNGYLGALIDIFGSHNLNPEPQIKTWEDVEEQYVEYQKYVAVSNDIEEGIINIEDKLRLKLLATYRIAKLIDLGYGGMVREEEWRDEKSYKYVILPSLYEEDGFSFNDVLQYRDRQFIAFHTPEQREEFMSHESNRLLVQQYYMM